MLQTKVLSLPKAKTIALAQFAVFLAIAVATPALIHFQPITGPIVNGLLFLSVILLGLPSAVLIALIPSVVALSVGLLPSPLAPAAPFIMLGNIILVFAFNFLRQKNFWLAVGLASLAKFLFLYSASYLVVNLISQQPIAQKAASMLSWPQFLTALGGGLLAYSILKTKTAITSKKEI